MEATLKKLIQPKSGSNINRPRRPDQWKKHRQKSSRVSGLAYETTKGTIVLEKRFRVVEKCCTLKCSKKVDASSQQYLFDEFWKRGKSKQIQDLNLAACLRKMDVKRQRINPSTRNRTNQWQYYVRLGSSDIRVCRAFIENLYQVGGKRLRIIQQKIIEGETSFREKRGHHNNRPYKTPENVLPLMKEHLSSISLDESFVVPSKHDEDARLDFKKLYNSFSRYYETKTETVVPISYRMYQTQFRRNSEFVLSSSVNEEYLGYADVEVVVYPQETGSLQEVNGQDSLIFVDELNDETNVDQLPMLPDNVAHELNTIDYEPDTLLLGVKPSDLDASHNHQSSLINIELDDSNHSHDNQDVPLPAQLADPNETHVKALVRKPFHPVGSCCGQKCYEKFEVSSQRYLYEDFWNRGKSKQIQDLYLASCFTKADIKTQAVNSLKRHRHKWNFFIRLDAINVPVCLSFLVNLYQISRKRIRIVQSKVLRGETSFPERRGRRNNHQKKLPSEVIFLMKKHLSLIPHYESTAAPRFKYFENPDLDLKKIYKAFCEYYEENMGTPCTINFHIYKNLFHTQPEFSFLAPVTNQCDFCDSFKVSALPSENQLIAQKAHEKFYKTYNELINFQVDEAKRGDCLMIEFDYTPSICIPRLNVPQEIYKRLPSVHSFNIHNHCDDSSYIYLFNESKTQKSIDSVISFIFATIQPLLQSKHTFQRVILLCNDCKGQSKLIPLVQFCSWMSTIHRIPFLQMFSIQGHSVNVCNHNFALFRQLNIKRTRLISAKSIIKDMVSARQHPSPFIVYYDTPIVDCWSQALTKFFAARPKNSDKQKFILQSYMQLEYTDGKVYANSTFYNNPQSWIEFNYLIKNIEIRSISLDPAVFPGVVPDKRQNVFSLFHLMTSEEIINFQESFGV